MTKVRTLSEAAADILKQSQSGAAKEPMHKEGGVEVQDLGGATTDCVDGGDVGSKSAAHIGQAPKPGPAPKHEGDKTGQSIKTDGATHTEGEYDTETGEKKQDTFSGDINAADITKMVAQTLKGVGVKEDIDAIFTGQDLSEEFKEKVTTIFEAAVVSRAVMVVEQLEEQIVEAAEASVEAVKAELEEQVNAYANYVASEWLEENKLAVESGLRSEITEEFMEGLKNLFAEHYIDIPEEKVEIVEAVAEELEDVREELNRALNANIELQAEINEAKKMTVINTVCEGLTATQIEKVKSLAEGVEFTTEGEYKEKLALIKESYFSNQVKNPKVQSSMVAKESVASENAQYTETSPLMEKYVQTISRTLQK